MLPIRHSTIIVLSLICTGVMSLPMSSLDVGLNARSTSDALESDVEVPNPGIIIKKTTDDSLEGNDEVPNPGIIIKI